MKKLLTAILLVALFAFAATAVAETPVIEKLEYEGNGYLELDFQRDVEYQNLSVSVKNAANEEFPVTVVEQDNDDLTIRVDNLEKGQSYTVAVSGIRSGASGEFETVTAEIALPEEGMPAIESVEYDRKDGEVEIDFMEHVEYKDLAVEITDLNGNTYEASVKESDSDSIELRTSGLVDGENYLLKVSGVSLKGLNNYLTVSQEFTAVDR